MKYTAKSATFPDPATTIVPNGPTALEIVMPAPAAEALLAEAASNGTTATVAVSANATAILAARARRRPTRPLRNASPLARAMAAVNLVDVTCII
jgi:hypothetical protein